MTIMTSASGVAYVQAYLFMLIIIAVSSFLDLNDAAVDSNFVVAAKRQSLDYQARPIFHYEYTRSPKSSSSFDDSRFNFANFFKDFPPFRSVTSGDNSKEASEVQNHEPSEISKPLKKKNNKQGYLYSQDFRKRPKRKRNSYRIAHNFGAQQYKVPYSPHRDNTTDYKYYEDHDGNDTHAEHHYRHVTVTHTYYNATNNDTDLPINKNKASINYNSDHVFRDGRYIPIVHHHPEESDANVKHHYYYNEYYHDHRNQSDSPTVKHHYHPKEYKVYYHDHRNKSDSSQSGYSKPVVRHHHDPPKVKHHHYFKEYHYDEEGRLIDPKKYEDYTTKHEDYTKKHEDYTTEYTTKYKTDPKKYEDYTTKYKDDPKKHEDYLKKYEDYPKKYEDYNAENSTRNYPYDYENTAHRDQDEEPPNKSLSYSDVEEPTYYKSEESTTTHPTSQSNYAQFPTAEGFVPEYSNNKPSYSSGENFNKNRARHPHRNKYNYNSFSSFGNEDRPRIRVPHRGTYRRGVVGSTGIVGARPIFHEKDFANSGHIGYILVDPHGELPTIRIHASLIHHDHIDGHRGQYGLSKAKSFDSHYSPEITRKSTSSVQSSIS